MSGRTIVITGGSSGIGLAAAIELARCGDELVLIGRHPTRLTRAVGRVARACGRTPRSYLADFANLDDVRAVAARISAEVDRIDVLANNAGLLAARTHGTRDSHDVTMQVNHLAGFLLTHLLLARLRAAATTAAPARLIATSSLAEAWGWLDVDRPAARLRRYRSRWIAYGASKQANLLFTMEAARRWSADGIVATSFFPGLVQTRFARSSLLFTLARPVPLLVGTPARGADTLVWLATAEEALIPGGYFAFRAPFVATPRSRDPDRAARLWSASLAAVGLPADVAGAGAGPGG